MADLFEKTPHPIDRHVGARVRMHRVRLGLRQVDLATRLGLSFQAVQKYETGAMRISASRLYEIAGVLGVTPAEFFEGYGAAQVPPDREGVAALPPERDINHRERRRLLQVFYGIKDPEVRSGVFRLIRNLVEPSGD